MRVLRFPFCRRGSRGGRGKGLFSPLFFTGSTKKLWTASSVCFSLNGATDTPPIPSLFILKLRFPGATWVLSWTAAFLDLKTFSLTKTQGGSLFLQLGLVVVRPRRQVRGKDQLFSGGRDMRFRLPLFLLEGIGRRKSNQSSDSDLCFALGLRPFFHTSRCLSRDGERKFFPPRWFFSRWAVAPGAGNVT